MINKLRGLVLVGCLALAPSAFAVSFGVGISAAAGGSGTWSLTGPTNLSNVSWSASLFNPYGFSTDIGPGSYFWDLSGNANYGVAWSLTVGNSIVDSGIAFGGKWFEIDENESFTVRAVPEPGTLALLGLGLLGIGFSVRRRQPEA